MKEIDRYKITSANGNSSNVTKCDDGHWVNYVDVVNFIGELHRTIHYLEKDNYELKDNLKCVEEGNIKLQARIKELESEKHINEIKAQGIEEAVEQVAMDCVYDEDSVIVLGRVDDYAEQLRNKYE